MTAFPFQLNDGGRSAAGFKGQAGDCVTRAIAIATGQPYREVYDALNGLATRERTGRRKRGKSSARTGVYRQTYERYLKSLGWTWVPTMKIGSGCKVHLVPEELPKDVPLVIALSKHLTAVVDNAIQDTYNPDRDGNRCVYGYYLPLPKCVDANSIQKG